MACFIFLFCRGRAYWLAGGVHFAGARWLHFDVYGAPIYCMSTVLGSWATGEMHFTRRTLKIVIVTY